MQVHLDNIPNELKERNQWVLWKRQIQNGKPTKLPIDAESLRCAKSNDSATWTTFETAVAARTKHGDDYGLGFMFSANDPFAGVDLDDCIDEQGQLSLAAIEILRDLGSYTEISPSGRGVKVFLKGSVYQGKGRRGPGPEGIKELECYDRGRFFAVTGNRHPDYPPSVCEANESLQRLISRVLGEPARPESGTPRPVGNAAVGRTAVHSDEAVLERARRRCPGKFDALYSEGDTSGYADDHSVADMALTGLLVRAADGDTSIADRLFRSSALFRPKWDEKHGPGTYGQMTLGKARSSWEAQRGESPSLGRVREPWNLQRDEEHGRTFPLTDAGNGERIAAHNRDVLRFDTGPGAWRVWDGKRWKLDDCEEALRIAVQTIRDTVEREQEPKAHGEDSIKKWAKQSESLAHTRAALAFAMAQEGMSLGSTDWDANRWLFNVENGTVDLYTGLLKPHDPSDACTKLASVTFDPAAACPRFNRFLRECFPGREDVVGFLQRWFGYCLTGDAKEQYLVIFVGPGANGKSTLLECIMQLMGDYARVAAPDLITCRSGDEHPAVVADLLGSRLAAVSESERGDALRENRVKQITGDAKIKARFMHQNYFEFDRTFKLVLVTNNLPTIADRTEAMQRRLLVVRFPVVIPLHDRNTGLAAELARERPGILQWMLQGLRDWRQHGLGPPADVLNGLGLCQAKRDPVQEFLDQGCVFRPDAETTSTALQFAFKRFCASRGVECKSRKLLDAVKARGAGTTRGSKTRGWRGVALVEAWSAA